MDKDVFLFFCSTVAQSVAGMLAFFGAFAMFRISEVERTLALQGELFLGPMSQPLGLSAEEALQARDHFISGRYRALVDMLEAIRARSPPDRWTADMQSAFGTLAAARRRREFIFTRGREILVIGMLAVLAGLAAMASVPTSLVDELGLVVCGVLLLATAWTLLRGIAIVLGRLPET